MRVLKWCAPSVLALTLCVPSADASTLWYNGDFDGENGLSNELNTAITDGFVYDNFLVSGDWLVTSIWSNNLMTFTATQAYWEIRSGVSTGDDGVLVASGTSSATQTATGGSAFGFTEYQILVGGLSVLLGPGEYWLMVAPIGSETGRSFVTTTSNVNGVGTYLPGEAFFDSDYFGSTFAPAGGLVGILNPDFSMGVAGTAAAVPEPSTLLLTGTAALFALRRRRRAMRERTPPAAGAR